MHFLSLVTSILIAAQQAPADQPPQPLDKNPGHLKMALVNIKSLYSDGPNAEQNQANIQANLKRHLQFIDELAAGGAEFVGFPELSINGYHFSSHMTWLSLTGPEVKVLQDKAREKGIYLSAGIAEQDSAGKRWNTQFVIDPHGRIIGKHHKIYLTKEKGFTEAGNEHNVFAVKGIKMGITICADGTDRKNLQALVDNGAQILYGPHANTTGGTTAGWYRFRADWGGPDGWIAQLKVYAALHNHAGLYKERPPGATDANTGWASGAWFIGPDGRTLAQMPSSSQKSDSQEFVLLYNIPADNGTAEEAFDFRPVASFLQFPKDMKPGPCSGVDIDSHGNVYVIQRKVPPILCFDSSGRLLRSWGTTLIGRESNMQGAHGIRIDKEDMVWITDRERHLVRKFDPTGQLLLTLGTEGFPGTGPNQFNRPTDVAFGPAGEIYVADGYGNSRVVKFDRKGRFLKSWGEKGSAPGQFDLPHTIAVGRDGRVYVGDRYNARIQIFDGDGNLKEIWPGFVPCGMAFDRNETLFVADGVSKVLQLNDRGGIVKSWGKEAKELGLVPEQRNVPAIADPGGFRFVPHLMAVDAQGNLYLADVSDQMLHKLERFRVKP